MICTSLKWDISSNDVTGFLLRRNIWEQSNLQCRKSVHAGASTARSMMFTRSATYLGGAATEPIKEERNETNAAPLRRRCCQCQIKTKLARFMFAASNVEGGDGHRPPTTTARDTYPIATGIIPALLSIGRLLTSALPWRGKYRSAEERGSGNGRLGQKHFFYPRAICRRWTWSHSNALHHPARVHADLDNEGSIALQ